MESFYNPYVFFFKLILIGKFFYPYIINNQSLIHNVYDVISNHSPLYSNFKNYTTKYIMRSIIFNQTCRYVIIKTMRIGDSGEKRVSVSDDSDRLSRQALLLHAVVDFVHEGSVTRCPLRFRQLLSREIRMKSQVRALNQGGKIQWLERE